MKSRPYQTRIALLVLPIAVLGAFGGDDDATSNSSAPSDTTAPAGGESSGSELDDLIAAAQEEGELNLYISAIEGRVAPFVEAFEEEYDIDVTVFRLGSGELNQRIRAEAETGADTVDVIFDAIEPAELLLESGIILSPDEFNVPDYPGNFPDTFLSSVGPIVAVNVFAVAYNSDIVSEAPQTWEALVDPELNGQVAMIDPTRGLPYIQLLEVLSQEYGDEFLSQLANQNLILGDAATVLQALGAGEAAVAPMPPAALASLVEQGAPLKYVIPDVSSGFRWPLTIASEAPNSNAAALFVHYAISEEGNTILNEFEGEAGPFEDELPSGFSIPDVSDARSAEILEVFGLE